jgi:hypothetical protein
MSFWPLDAWLVGKGIASKLKLQERGEEGKAARIVQPRLETTWGHCYSHSTSRKLGYIMPFDPPSLILDEARKKDGTHVWMCISNQKTKIWTYKILASLIEIKRVYPHLPSLKTHDHALGKGKSYIYQLNRVHNLRYWNFIY